MITKFKIFETVDETHKSLKVGDYAIYNGNGKSFPNLIGTLVKIIQKVNTGFEDLVWGPRIFKIYFLEYDISPKMKKDKSKRWFDVDLPYWVVGEKLLSEAPQDKIEEYEDKIKNYDVYLKKWKEEHPFDPYGEEIWER